MSFFQPNVALIGNFGLVIYEKGCAIIVLI